MRALYQDVTLNKSDLIAPIFVTAERQTMPIESLPGVNRYCLADLNAVVSELVQVGVQSILLFGIPNGEDKTPDGAIALSANGIVQTAIKQIRAAFPELNIIADLCFCQYTDHGHCGVLAEDGQSIDNDQTCQMLGQQAVTLALAGADIVAPSACADGMVQAIRLALDNSGLLDCGIMSYGIKYASNFYGPFRDAGGGAPQFGDRKSYQMDCRCQSDALTEAQQDRAEGADSLIVKPAIHYLDVIRLLKDKFPDIPLIAYHVSGEYAMLMQYFKDDPDQQLAALLEANYALKRAGVTAVITYGALAIAQWLDANE